MKIKWLAHSSFLITTASGTRIITDPYGTGNGIGYRAIDESADIVTVSHEHFDHWKEGAVRGNPEIVKGSAEVKGIKFKAIPTDHDESGGSERGKNTIFCFDIDGLKVCHAGDLGHMLTDEQAREIGKVDILMIPVGGFFTIDANTASQVCDKLKPAIIIPMHYKTDRLDFPIVGVDNFLKGKTNVKRVGGSEIEVEPGKLPVASQIMVPEPAN